MPIGRMGRGVQSQVGIVADGQLMPVQDAGSVLDLLGKPVGVTDTPTEFDPALPVDWTASLRDCVGFLDHVRNARQARGVTEELPQPWFDRPAFYFANPSSLHAWNEPVAVSPGCAKFDFEFEIAAVLSSGGTNLTAAEAADCIGGYVLYCDWSARDIQTEERAMQIGQGKGKDGAISLGPWIVTKEEIAEYRREDGFAFDISVTVNGETLLKTEFTGMDWTFEELAAYSSHGAGVARGDIIASGTIPRGCLMEVSSAATFRGWLQPGDHVVLDGGPLGTISAAIHDAPDAPDWRRTTTTRTQD